MTDKKYSTWLCPENCNYRNRRVPFCGYCLYRIVNGEEEEKDANRKTEDEHAKQAD